MAGVVQGLGQALMEQVVYERSSGTTDNRIVHGLCNATRARRVRYRGTQQPAPDIAEILWASKVLARQEQSGRLRPR